MSEFLDEVPEALNRSYIIKIIDVSGAVLLEKESILENPWAFDVKSLVPLHNLRDIGDVYEFTRKLIDDSQREKDQNLRVQFVKEWPPEKLEDFINGEVITARLISKKPANMSADGKSKTIRRNRYSHHFFQPEFPSKVILVTEQPKDHIVEFSCWATTALQADARALWLEELLSKNTYLYKIHGADRFYFQERLMDEVMKHGEHRFHKRPLRFFIRLTELELIAEPVINNIETHIQTT